MTKPDDIDQDAWDASIALYEAVIEVEPFTSASLTIIARAIMAARAEEREACAQTAETCTLMVNLAPGLADGAAAASRQIAAAIRNRP